VSANDPNNPMQDPDRTVLVPSPGGRRTPPASAPPAPPAGTPPARPAAAGVPPQLHGEGLNPLVRAANPLLDLVTPLRYMASHPDVETLRTQLVQAIKAFEAAAKAAHVEHDQIAAARYALCTLLDETISSTPWGGGGIWASRSLLVAFHNEAFGGEKFFLILQKLSQDPKANLVALELMYLCLALGLEGRYRVIDNGRSQLDTLRDRLQGLIAQQRAPMEAELSVHWQGASGKGEPLWRMVPVWILAAVAAVLLVVLQLFLGHRLGNASDPVFASLLSLKTAQAPALPPAAVPVPAPVPARIAGFLAPEVAQGLVSVVETADRSVVTLRGDGVFGSGSGEVSGAYLPLLARIGEALKSVPGKVVVVGHTDNTKPGLSARFPSNYELSKARAAAVRDLLAERAGPPERYSVEGRGDSAPLVANDNAANRARNRRVEITLLTPAAAP
jgi:type VI secretion system protein ImpK